MPRARLALSLVVLAVNSGYAESDDGQEDIEEIVVTGDLDSLPGDDIRSVSGSANRFSIPRGRSPR